MIIKISERENDRRVRYYNVHPSMRVSCQVYQLIDNSWKLELVVNSDETIVEAYSSNKEQLYLMAEETMKTIYQDVVFDFFEILDECY